MGAGHREEEKKNRDQGEKRASDSIIWGQKERVGPSGAMTRKRMGKIVVKRRLGRLVPGMGRMNPGQDDPQRPRLVAITGREVAWLHREHVVVARLDPAHKVTNVAMVNVDIEDVTNTMSFF